MLSRYKPRNLKHLLKRWAASTSAHGWSQLIEKQSKCSLCFWISSQSLFTFLVMATVVGSFRDFYNHPHYVRTASLEHNETLMVPDIKICSFNRISRAKAERHNLTSAPMRQYLLKTLFGLNPIIPMPKSLFANANLSIEMSLWMEANNFTLTNAFMYLGPDCFPTILRVTREGKDLLHGMCSNDQAFRNDDLEIKPVFDQRFGQCFSVGLINEEDRHTDKAGVANALSFLLYIDLFDTLPEPLNNFWESGLAMFFGNSDDFVPLTPGFRTWVALEPEESLYEGLAIDNMQMNRPCVESRWPLLWAGDQWLRSSTTNCKMECQFYWKFAVLMNCSGNMASPYYPPCTPQQLQTLDYNIQSTNDSNYTELHECVNERCKPLCQSAHYKTSVTSTKLLLAPDMVTAISQLAQNEESNNDTDTNMELYRELFPTPEAVRDRLIMVDVYFPTMDVQYFYTNLRVTSSTFLSKLGGQLGLWSGISWITLVHLVATLLCPLCCPCLCCAVDVDEEEEQNEQDGQKK